MKNSALSKKQLAYILGVAIIFIAWSGIFIWQSSGIALDGKRYFCLFDDAMIAMRYAWNLSHGNGLVWNTGERVEGITTMSLTLLMSAVTWVINNKSASCLAIQIIGMIIMLLYARTNIKISRILFKSLNNNEASIKKHQNSFYAWLPVIVFILSLSYYPLLYFSLLGMETGLLALLISLITCKVLQENTKPDYWLGILYVLAFYTRPDAAIPIAIFFIYRFWQLTLQTGYQKAIKSILPEGIILLIFIIAIHIFRYYYYGYWLPNTYALKIEGMSLGFRIQNGFGFIKLFLKETILLWPFIFLAMIYKPKKQAVLLICLFIASILYQVWTGGDPWIFWRMMAPYVPLMFILVLFITFQLISKLREQPFYNKKSNLIISRPYKFSLFPVLILILGLVTITANRRFLSVIAFKYAPYQTDSNRNNVNIALALNELTTESATVAVLWGGTIPFYSKNLRAIDMLGKSDKYIASLPPDLNTPYNGMKSLVGHNKYDLEYSVIKLKPTYVQQFYWFNQDVSEYGKENYVQVDWKGVKLHLLKNSPDVHWEKLRN